MSIESDLAQKAIIEAVENQLRDNNPPIAQETFTRLKLEGYSVEEAKKLIAFALASEISDVMNSNEPFNEERYSQNLNNLPDLPWEE
jgi:hypothetical protein